MTKITDGKLFTLFTGQQDPDRIIRNGAELVSCVHRLNFDTEEMEPHHCSIGLEDLEDIKDIFSSNVLKSLSHAEYLLLILWIREFMFIVGSLPDNDRFGFVKNVFALSGIEINEETMGEEFRVLWCDKDNIYVETAGDKIKNYRLTPAGESVAEEIYSRMATVATHLKNSKSSPDQKRRRAGNNCANEKRDRFIYEQRKAGMPFAKICDQINKDFPGELVEEKSASEALKRYCDRHKIDYPYGKRGRKSDR